MNKRFIIPPMFGGNGKAKGLLKKSFDAILDGKKVMFVNNDGAYTLWHDNRGLRIKKEKNLEESNFDLCFIDENVTMKSEDIK